MGTRSLTIIKDEEGEIVVMYRQLDGYVKGHGRELVKFLKPFTIVNGLGQNPKKVANGGGCLAAQIIAKFKKEAGGFYLHPAGTRDAGEEYRYTVTVRPSCHSGQVQSWIQLQIEMGYGKNWKTLYDGDVKNCITRVVEKIEAAE